MTSDHVIQREMDIHENEKVTLQFNNYLVTCKLKQDFFPQIVLNLTYDLYMLQIF